MDGVRRGRSERSGISRHHSVGKTVAAVLQGSDELYSATTENIF